MSIENGGEAEGGEITDVILSNGVASLTLRYLVVGKGIQGNERRLLVLRILLPGEEEGLCPLYCTEGTKYLEVP
jgi:hypothetical protein